MSASLVGSEMCIRDSPRPPATPRGGATAPSDPPQLAPPARDRGVSRGGCLLYTSDAADDM
eukprot:462904-Alexandrium_andersonii.AAC.1